MSDGAAAVIETVRTPDHQLPAEAVLSFRAAFADYQAVSVRQKRFGAPGSRQQAIGFPGVLEAGQGRALAADWLRRRWSDRERISFSLPQPSAGIEPGAIIRVPASGDGADFLVVEVEDGLARKVAARQITRAAPAPWRSGNPALGTLAAPVVGQPLAIFLDLPSNASAEAPQDRFRVAAWQKPWKSQAGVRLARGDRLCAAHHAWPAGRHRPAGRAAGAGTGRPHRSWLGARRSNFFGGEAASVSRNQLLNGANVAALRSAAGACEILQFESAEEIAPDIWRLTGLLRGQLGTEGLSGRGGRRASRYPRRGGRAGGPVTGEEGLALNWRIGPTGADFSSASFVALAETGGVRALLPLSPVHLRATPDGEGGVTLSWIRRGRLDADSWTPSDIPLGEAREDYSVEIAAAGGAAVRSAIVTETAFAYPAALIAADFGVVPAEIDVTIRQLSVAAGWGIPATRRLPLS